MGHFEHAYNRLVLLPENMTQRLRMIPRGLITHLELLSVVIWVSFLFKEIVGK